MKITFTETEDSERPAFEAALGNHELHFVRTLAEVEADTEILCVFIASRIDDAFLAGHPRIRFIATRSTTHDHIDLVACERRGIPVAVVESYGDHVVAEHTLALLLALTRRLREAMHLNGNRFSYERLRGTELYGKTFGILGGGRIGRKIVPIARAFGMQVLVCDIRPRPECAGTLGFTYVDFDELLRRSDVLSLHAPLTGDTFHILDRAAFAKCRPGVLIINTARGRLIDTAALLEALESGIVGGAGLDVLGEEIGLRREATHIIGDQILNSLHGERASSAAEREREVAKLMLIGHLLARPDVVFTPHTAFNCIEAIERIHATTIANLQRFLAGERLDPSALAGTKRQSAEPSDEMCLAGEGEQPVPDLQSQVTALEHGSQ